VPEADRHGWWKVDQPFEHVLNYVQAHSPRGGRLQMTGGSGGPGQPNWEFVTFTFPAKPRVLGDRWLTVTLIQLRDGSTGVRVDGQVQWIIPRPASEVVPAGAQVVQVTRTGSAPISRTVTAPAKVQEIVRLLDRLQTVQPGVEACGTWVGSPPMVHLGFRTADGRLLAQARMLAYNVPADPCNDMGFMIGTRHERPLLAGGRFLHQVGRVIGVQLAVRPPG
jgi:hypothetical protein